MQHRIRPRSVALLAASVVGVLFSCQLLAVGVLMVFNGGDLWQELLLLVAGGAGWVVSISLGRWALGADGSAETSGAA